MIDADGSIELTSGCDDQVDDTVGKNRRREGQADAERLPFDGDRLLPLPSCRRSPWTTGTGNSPPARKFAVSPDSATSVGSASVVTAPFVSSASSVDVEVGAERPECAQIRSRKLSMMDPSLLTGSPVGDYRRRAVRIGDRRRDGCFPATDSRRCRSRRSSCCR